MTMLARLTGNALVRHTPRFVFLGAAFVVRDVQAHFDIPTVFLLIAALPGIVIITAVTDQLVGWMKHLLDALEGSDS